MIGIEGVILGAAVLAATLGAFSFVAFLATRHMDRAAANYSFPPTVRDLQDALVELQWEVKGLRDDVARLQNPAQQHPRDESIRAGDEPRSEAIRSD